MDKFVNRHLSQRARRR